MTVYLAGNEFDIVSTNSGGAVTTDGNVAIAGINRSGMEFFGSFNNAIINIPTGVAEGWVHARINRTTSTSGGGIIPAFDLLNSSDQRIGYVGGISSGESGMRLQPHTGTQVYVAGLTLDIDINFKVDAAVGFVKFYVNGNFVTEFVGNVQFPSGPQLLSRIKINGVSNTGNNNNSTWRFSQIIVANTPTLGARVHTLPLTVAATNQWTGTPTNVTGTSSLGTISESTVDEEISFNAADLATAIQAGFIIDAVVISSRAQALTGSPVSRIQGRTRVGGTPYSVGGSILLGTGFSVAQHIIGVNPATGASWTGAELNAAEFGYQAKA